MSDFMRQQLELFPYCKESSRLTVAEACGFIWRHHLKSMPSGPQAFYNLAALSNPQSMGNVHICALMDTHIRRHLDLRARGVIGRKPAGQTTMRHDLKWLTLLLNKVRRWKRKNYVIDDIDFSKINCVDPRDLFDGIKRPKFQKRRRIVIPNEMAKITEHADLELTKLVECLIDTGARLEDALVFEPPHYNPYTDQIEWVQQKTGKVQFLPVSARVREHFIEAKNKGWKNVYNGINLRSRWETVREKANVPDIQIGWDFRKTTYNEGRRFTKSPDIGRQLMGHTSNRTGEDYYHVEQREDLRPVISHIEKKFITRRKNTISPSRKKREVFS